ncbi:MAG: hypothetical protein K6C36_03885 [Clostridia bacterium]|nr:hypothetical protein [Clostridia bacterium]
MDILSLIRQYLGFFYELILYIKGLLFGEDQRTTECPVSYEWQESLDI